MDVPGMREKVPYAEWLDARSRDRESLELSLMISELPLDPFLIAP